jgi:hypothetical protein
LKRVRLYDVEPKQDEGQQQPIRSVAVSSRYGLVLALGPGNRVYACQAAHIHSLGLLVEGEPELGVGSVGVDGLPLLRQTQYHDPQVLC